MKKALKITGKILLCILILLIAFLLILFVYHRIMLNKEDKLLENYPDEVEAHLILDYLYFCSEHICHRLTNFQWAGILPRNLLPLS